MLSGSTCTKSWLATVYSDSPPPHPPIPLTLALTPRYWEYGEQATYNEADVAAKILGARQAWLAFSACDNGLPISRSISISRESDGSIHHNVLPDGELAGVYCLAQFDDRSGEPGGAYHSTSLSTMTRALMSRCLLVAHDHRKGLMCGWVRRRECGRPWGLEHEIRVQIGSAYYPVMSTMLRIDKNRQKDALLTPIPARRS